MAGGRGTKPRTNADNIPFTRNKLRFSWMHNSVSIRLAFKRILPVCADSGRSFACANDSSYSRHHSSACRHEGYQSLLSLPSLFFYPPYNGIFVKSIENTDTMNAERNYCFSLLSLAFQEAWFKTVCFQEIFISQSNKQTNKAKHNVKETRLQSSFFRRREKIESKKRKKKTLVNPC